MLLFTGNWYIISFMSDSIDIISEIEKLPPIERIRIIDKVMRDIIQPDSDVDKAWAQEATIRWEAYKKGKVNLIPYETVMSKYRIQ